MRKRVIMFVAVLGLAAALAVGLATATGATKGSTARDTVAAPAAAQDLGQKFGKGTSTQLTGSVEVPAGDPDAAGTAVVRLDTTENLVCFKLVVRGADVLAAAHIHRGAAGVAGPVIIPLATPTPTAADSNVQQSKGCVSADPALIREILATPAGFYVNVHNKEFPAGVVRGQLRKLSEKAAKPQTCAKPKKKKRQ